MNITITGASGLVGRRLLKNLGGNGHTLTVVSRHAGTNVPAGVSVVAWDPMQGPAPEDSVRNAGAVIHLAGEPVSQRWSADVKRRIRDSRVVGTRHLVQALARLRNTPETLVCASAVGYYGSRGDEVLREDSAPDQSYLAEVCAAWEKEAVAAEAFGMRVVRVRIGVVLDARGGALQRMLPPFRMGVGGRLGDGKQWMSWIHLADLAAMFQFAVDNPVRGALNGVALDTRGGALQRMLMPFRMGVGGRLGDGRQWMSWIHRDDVLGLVLAALATEGYRGPVNATAPAPVTNREFTHTLAGVVSRPAILPVPGFALHLVMGEMADMLLTGQRVLPKVAEAQAYEWKFPALAAALKDVVPL